MVFCILVQPIKQETLTKRNFTFGATAASKSAVLRIETKYYEELQVQQE